MVYTSVNMPSAAAASGSAAGSRAPEPSPFDATGWAVDKPPSDQPGGNGSQLVSLAAAVERLRERTSECAGPVFRAGTRVSEYPQVFR